MLAEVRKAVPQAPIIYAADIAGLPYGAKSEAEVAARVCGLLGRMAERWQPRLICIACNTASTIALGMVRDVLETPIVGTVPAIKPAAAISNTGVIGVLGTEATIRQGYVDRLEAQFANGKTLFRHGANGLVALAEKKLRGGAVTPAAATAELAEMLRHPLIDQLDTVVLACTHFPLLLPELSEAFGPSVRFVDGAKGIAQRVHHLTGGQAFDRPGSDRAVTTGSREDWQQLGPALAEYGLERLETF